MYLMLEFTCKILAQMLYWIVILQSVRVLYLLKAIGIILASFKLVAHYFNKSLLFFAQREYCENLPLNKKFLKCNLLTLCINICLLIVNNLSGTLSLISYITNIWNQRILKKSVIQYYKHLNCIKKWQRTICYGNCLYYYK